VTRFSERRRDRQIGSAAARHGLGYLAGPAGLGRLVPFQRAITTEELRRRMGGLR
jgi:hypothetical protein